MPIACVKSYGICVMKAPNIPLSQVKTIKDAAGATVNDVMVAALAGAMYDIPCCSLYCYRLIWCMCLYVRVEQSPLFGVSW